MDKLFHIVEIRASICVFYMAYLKPVQSYIFSFTRVVIQVANSVVLQTYTSKLIPMWLLILSKM